MSDTDLLTLERAAAAGDEDARRRLTMLRRRYTKNHTRDCDIKNFLKSLFSADVVRLYRLPCGDCEIVFFSDSETSIGSFEIELLMKLFGVDYNNIDVSAWQVTVEGCDTCAYQREGKITISIRAPVLCWEDNLTVTLAKQSEHKQLLIEQAQEKQEEIYRLSRQNAERFAREEAEYARALDEATIAWNQYRSAIIDAVINMFSSIDNPDRKTFAIRNNGNCRNLFFSLWKNKWNNKYSDNRTESFKSIIANWIDRSKNNKIAVHSLFKQAINA